MRMLRRHGQLKAMREQGWTEDDFRREFGKSYL
nr:MAG TPA: ROS/MUCR transcriptional regulator protein [Caudoviricetes sp.]